MFLGLCLGCGDTKISIPHPLFEGGLCEECKVCTHFNVSRLRDLQSILFVHRHFPINILTLFETTVN